MMRSSVLLCAALALSGCKTMEVVKEKVSAIVEPSTPPSRPVIEKLPTKYTPSGQAIGEAGDLANLRSNGKGLIDVPELNTYLNRLLQRIKQETKLEDAPGRVYINTSADPEAVATPDGNIIVSMTMLKNIESEDELVALLAHEFGHVALGHHDSDVWGNYQKQIQGAFAIASQLQSNLEAGRGNAQLSKGQSATLNKMQMAIELTDVVLHPAWKRGQEDEADRFAIDLTTKLGYSFGRGSKAVLEKQASLDETVTAIRKQRFEADVASFTSGGNINVSGLLQTTLGGLKDAVSRSHTEGNKRVAAAVAYHETFYDDMPRSEPKTEPWLRVWNAPSVSGVFKNYALADEAYMALQQKDLRKARALAEQAAKAPTDAHAYTLLALAQVHAETGDQRSYDRTVQRLESLKDPVWPYYQMRAERELQSGRIDKAEQIYEEGYRRFGAAPALRPQMIGFYQRINKKDKSDAIAVDCSFRNPGQRESCLKAASGKK